jgi:uncharacterized tellurite resistance protein B-like protein
MQKTHQVPPHLTPATCFVVSMFYAMMSDGEIDPEEMGYLSTVLGGKKAQGSGFQLEPSAVVDQAMNYVKNNSPDTFLKQVTEQKLLTNEQKLFILTHMISMAYSDGNLEPMEAKLLSTFTAVFNVPNEHLAPVFNFLKFKYNKSVIGL